jgi:hypothetical protein
LFYYFGAGWKFEPLNRSGITVKLSFLEYKKLISTDKQSLWIDEGKMYELLIFIFLSITLECGMGILYGVAIGYNPLLVFPAAIILNFLMIFVVVSIIDRLLNWKKGVKNWIEKRLARGRKIIDKYGSVGVIMGIFVLSPVQLAIVGKLMCMKPRKLYPSLLIATVLVAAVYLGVAIGVFKFLL